MKIDNHHLAITTVITDSSIDSSMDTKASGLKCHKKQDIHMVNRCKTPVNNKEKNCNFEKTVRNHHNQVQIQHRW